MTTKMPINNPTIGQRKKMREAGWKIAAGCVAGRTSYFPALEGGGYSWNEVNVGVPVTQIVGGCPAYHAEVAWLP